MIPLFDDNPTRNRPYLTVTLMLINTAIFILQWRFTNFDHTLYAWGAIPLEVTQGVDMAPYIPVPVHLTLISSMFLHGGLLHLMGNMLYLWIFGDNVEDMLGRPLFILFYLACGVAAALAHVAEAPGSDIPMVGASGAVSGLLAAYLLAYPRAKVYTLFWFIIFIRIIPLPAWVIIGLWFLVQVSNVGMGGQIAFGAHIGGFVAGLALYPAIRLYARMKG